MSSCVTFNFDGRFISVLNVAAGLLREGGLLSLRRVSEGELTVEALKLLGCRVPYLDEVKKEWCSLEELGLYDDVSPSPLRVFSSTEELLYRNWPTPLVRLQSLSRSGVAAWAKLEFYNPFSMSVKDRVGWAMVREFLERNPSASAVLYEATSTNTGMALAAMAAIKGLKAKLFLPQTIQRASDVLLSTMGAEVHRVPKSLTVETIGEVEELARRGRGVHLNQFDNDANFKVHFKYTAKELDLQVRSAGLRLCGIFSGIGTSGHLSALSLYFKCRYGDHVGVYAVQPAEGHAIPGIRRLETGMKWIHLVRVDRIVDVTLEEAVEGVLRVARGDGILVGLSSGAVATVFEKLTSELERGDYVLVFPDHGFKYVKQLSKYFKAQAQSARAAGSE